MTGYWSRNSAKSARCSAYIAVTSRVASVAAVMSSPRSAMSVSIWSRITRRSCAGAATSIWSCRICRPRSSSPRTSSRMVWSRPPAASMRIASSVMIASRSSARSPPTAETVVRFRIARLSVPPRPSSARAPRSRPRATSSAPGANAELRVSRLETNSSKSRGARVRCAGMVPPSGNVGPPWWAGASSTNRSAMTAGFMTRAPTSSGNCVPGSSVRCTRTTSPIGSTLSTRPTSTPTIRTWEPT